MEKTIEKIDIRSLNYKELQEEMTRIGEKAFRGKQIYEWLHVKLADSFQEMTNLSRSLREKLEGVSDQWSLKTVWGVGYKFELHND